MTLFHGSNKPVEIPNLAFSRNNLDFGAGYYTTVNKDQAIEFAQKVMLRKNDIKRFVSVYDFDMETEKSLLFLKYRNSFEPGASL